MRFFFRSRQFKIAAVTAAVILILAIAARIAGGVISPQASLFGTIAAPFQKMATAVSNAVDDFKRQIGDNQDIILENARLQDMINQLNNKIVNYDELKSQNDFYKNYLGIKDDNPDFSLSDAVIISRDTTDIYGGFTVDKGTLSGISTYDPVLTDAGLVGYISEVGLTTSKVTTVMNPNISVGVIDSRTRDAGVVSGSVSLAPSKLTRMNNLLRSSSVAIGDYIVTSGSGVFPGGIPVGKISNIAQEQHYSTLYAEVELFVNLSEIKQVMIITDFEGKNHISLSPGDNKNEK